MSCSRQFSLSHNMMVDVTMEYEFLNYEKKAAKVKPVISGYQPSRLKREGTQSSDLHLLIYHIILLIGTQDRKNSMSEDLINTNKPNAQFYVLFMASRQRLKFSSQSLTWLGMEIYNQVSSCTDDSSRPLDICPSVFIIDIKWER